MKKVNVTANMVQKKYYQVLKRNLYFRKKRIAKEKNSEKNFKNIYYCYIPNTILFPSSSIIYLPSLKFFVFLNKII